MNEGSEPTVDIGTPVATSTLPSIAERPPRTKILALTFLVVAAGAFLAGIVIASTIEDEPPGTLLTSEVVGPSGGTVRFSGGEIRVPAGALDSPTELAVRRTVVAERVQVRPDGRPVQIFDKGELLAYVFSPADVEFLRPVTIIFRLQREDADATAFARVGGSTVLLPGGIDENRRIVAVEVSDFRFNRAERSR